MPAQEAALAVEAETKMLANPATGADRVAANEVITPSRTTPTSSPSRIVFEEGASMVEEGGVFETQPVVGISIEHNVSTMQMEVSRMS